MTAARDARAAVGATSYARAIEQALWAAEAGIGARQVIAACGVSWPDKAPTWEDAVYVLAMSWRRHCADRPLGVARGDLRERRRRRHGGGLPPIHVPEGTPVPPGNVVVLPKRRAA